jgi:amicyanin
MKLLPIYGIIALVVVLMAGFLFLQNSKGSSTGLVIYPNPENTGNNDNPISENTGTTYNLDISNFAFNPKEITIKKGDTVKWTNLDSVQHTVTSDSGNELNSELFGNGESYSHTFTQQGTFNYYCIPHPRMKGTIIVE